MTRRGRTKRMRTTGPQPRRHRGVATLWLLFMTAFGAVATFQMAAAQSASIAESPADSPESQRPAPRTGAVYGLIVDLPTPPQEQLRGADIRVHQWYLDPSTPSQIRVHSWDPDVSSQITHDWDPNRASRIRVRSWDPDAPSQIRVHGPNATSPRATLPSLRGPHP